MTRITLVLLLAACATDDVEPASDAVISEGTISPQRVIEGRPLLQEVWRRPLMDARPTDPQLELFDLLVECALPVDDVLRPDPTQPELRFFGELGLVRAWRHRGLTHDERRWISACVIAKLNLENVVTSISMRGERRQLRRPHDERAAFPLQEGAFTGDLFGHELRWAACAGRDSGRIPDRDCTVQDSAHPELTRCGMTFLGSCRHACERRGDLFVECGERYPVVTVYGSLDNLH